MRHRASQRWLFTTKDKRPLANIGRNRSQPVGVYRYRYIPKSLKEHVLIAKRIDSNNFKSYGQVRRCLDFPHLSQNQTFAGDTLGRRWQAI